MQVVIYQSGGKYLSHFRVLKILKMQLPGNYLSPFLVLKILKVLQRQLFIISSICLLVKIPTPLKPYLWISTSAQVLRVSKHYNTFSKVCDICRFFLPPHFEINLLSTCFLKKTNVDIYSSCQGKGDHIQESGQRMYFPSSFIWNT